MKTIIQYTALALALTASAADKPVPASTDYIHTLAAEAVRHHPKIAAAQSRTQAALEAVHAVRLWEDPQMGLGATAASRDYRRSNGDIAIGIDQALPRRGLYDAETRRAEAEHKMQGAEQRMSANELGLSVAHTVIELALSDDLLRLQAEELRWFEDGVKTAQERAKNPNASAVESLRLESELAMRAQKYEAAKRQRSQIAVALNLLLGRSTKASWAELTLMEKETLASRTDFLQAQLERKNPRLTSLRYQSEAALAAVDAAKEKSKPVVSLGVQTNTYSRSGFFDAMFTVKMTLPWFNRSAYRADAARAEHLHSAAQDDLNAQSRELAAQVNALRTEAENGRRLADAYNREVLPKAEKMVEATLNAWVSSKATLLEVLEARRALLEVRQEQKRATAAQQAAGQSITALAGGFSTLNEKQP